MGTKTAKKPAAKKAVKKKAPTVKKKQGRPVTKHLTGEIFERIIARFVDGEGIKAICTSEGFTYQHFLDEIRKSADFLDRYTHAKPGKGQALRESVLDDLSVDPPMTPDGRYDSAYVNLMRARAEIKMRLADALDPLTQKTDAKISTPDGKAPFAITVELMK
jgi:hypothetical protein